MHDPRLASDLGRRPSHFVRDHRPRDRKHEYTEQPALLQQPTPPPQLRRAQRQDDEGHAKLHHKMKAEVGHGYRRPVFTRDAIQPNDGRRDTVMRQKTEAAWNRGRVSNAPFLYIGDAKEGEVATTGDEVALE